MALDGTSAGLRASIADWLNRGDLTAQIPDFILMAEGRLNRILRTPDMEAHATASTIAGNEFVAFPTGFIGMREFHIQGNPIVNLDQMSLGEMHREFSLSPAAKPKKYAIANNQIALGPIPDGAYVLDMFYYAKLPPLASNATNWLLTAHPDLYLYAALLQSEAFIIDDERIGLWQTAMDRIVAEIAIDSERKRWGSAPIAPAISMTR
jgi:hypothetical protein